VTVGHIIILTLIYETFETAVGAVSELFGRKE
jgi:hypothetical protein